MSLYKGTCTLPHRVFRVFGLLMRNSGLSCMAAYMSCDDHHLANPYNNHPYIYYYYLPYATYYNHPTISTYYISGNTIHLYFFFPSPPLLMDHSSSQPSVSISELDSHCGGPGGPATANEPAHEEQSMVTKNDIVSGGAGQAAAATHTMLRSGFPRVRDGRRTAWKAKSVMMSHDGPDGSEPAASHGFESDEPARCTKTTVMIKNIPNRFTETLLEIMDDYCRSENQRGVHAISTTAYDFLYLPIDFWSKANKGYAFVNFTTPTAAWSFRLFFTKYKWDLHNSKKICEVTYARIQGKDAMIEHFRSTVFPCTTDEYLPVYFEPSRDGSTKLVKQCVVGKAVSSLRYKT